MVFIKKLVMYGFKSFVRKTEIPMSEGINVILGPNGSGKSNVSDALCFVLGRLSVKSMRAAKAKNLIFLGNKAVPPAREASVEIVFDNTDKTFSIDKNEISIKRIVRKNGQSVYKIENEVKTRQEILTLLAQAEIDPNGFNIILQGEIHNFARMHTEERRRVIEEVSGISIYEVRKEKSLRELKRTEDRLGEIMAILKERTTYLNNLERERQQALRYKKLETDAKKFKASIITSDLTKKKKEKEFILTNILKKEKEIEKVKKTIIELQTAIQSFDTKISFINSTIQKSTGLEQEKLNQEIADLRAELAGLNVRSDNLDKKIHEISKQKQGLEETIRDNGVDIAKLKKESPTKARKEKDIEEKKQELERLEEQRKKFYITKSELKSIKDRLKDKETILQGYENESEFLLKQIKSISLEIFDTKSDIEKLSRLKTTLAEKKDSLEILNKRENELEKISYTNEREIEKQEKIIENISRMDTCPLCKSKITKEHMISVKREISNKLKLLKKEVEGSDKELNSLYEKRDVLKQDVEQINSEISRRESDMVKMSSINTRQEQIKSLHERIEKSKTELSELEKKRKFLEKRFEENSGIEQKYETVRIEVQEISFRSKENIDSEISFKQREFERAKISLKQLSREEEDLCEDLKEIKKDIAEKEELLEDKKQAEEALTEKFRKLIRERDSFQSKIKENEIDISREKNIVYRFEQEINEFKIEKARVGAEIENYETEMLNFDNVEIIKANRDTLSERLAKTQEILSRIGTVNFRSLEVYDSIKKEYDSIKERVDIITNEKEGIMKIIQEIDIKKKKTFLRTLKELNELFSRNFAQLSTKGQVYLELENKKDPFEGGVGIVVKTGHGKYFDVTSLSGGEQTIVALSLIFAIQELRPYCFYILDEIDAALDKRNSERLAGLLKKYMKKGQYIVITHNDEIITNATTLYGVSMHDGVSKIISLKL